MWDDDLGLADWDRTGGHDLEETPPILHTFHRGISSKFHHNFIAYRLDTPLRSSYLLPAELSSGL
jgi:hypothetical protein